MSAARHGVGDGPGPAMGLDRKINFDRPTVHRGLMTATDTDKRFFFKAQILREAKESRDLGQEAEIIQRLNAAGSVTCPRLEHRGVMTRADAESMAGGKFRGDDGRGVDDG